MQRSVLLLLYSTLRLFQGDNAHPHTARAVQAFLDKNPDMSPIEQTWHMLSQHVHQRQPQPLTTAQLQEGRAIPQQQIRTLVLSVLRWVTACIISNVTRGSSEKLNRLWHI
uniref:Uncharacterized protein n=1 Tax=Neolamprologus brichardi TaxID=32507 RepID=A0A3Q4GEC9_NEOBR